MPRNCVWFKPPKSYWPTGRSFGPNIEWGFTTPICHSRDYQIMAFEQFGVIPICISPVLAALLPALAMIAWVTLESRRQRKTEKPPQSEKLLRPAGHSLSVRLVSVNRWPGIEALAIRGQVELSKAVPSDQRTRWHHSRKQRSAPECKDCGSDAREPASAEALPAGTAWRLKPNSWDPNRLLLPASNDSPDA